MTAVYQWCHQGMVLRTPIKNIGGVVDWHGKWRNLNSTQYTNLFVFLFSFFVGKLLCAPRVSLMRTPSSHINGGTHHSCEREEYAFMVHWDYLIISEIHISKEIHVRGREYAFMEIHGQMPLLKKKKIQHFTPFPKLIREMPLFWNLIFSKSSCKKIKK